MADVRRTERGQLLLVTALALAVMFVSLALALNTAIYTENLATRGSDIAGGSDVLSFEGAVQGGVSGLLERTNRHHNATHATLTRNLTDELSSWESTATRQQSLSGDVIALANHQVTNGSRIVQTNGSRNFTAANGSTDWTLSSDAKGIRRLTFNLTSDLLPDSGSLAIQNDSVNTFNVEITNDSGSTWRVHVYGNLTGTSVNVLVEHPTGTFTAPCSRTGEHVVLDLVEGTLGGDGCQALDVAGTVSDPANVTFQETRNATGTYDVVLADPAPAQSPPSTLNEGSTADSPWVVPVIYAVEVDTVVESTRLRYNAIVRIAPGEIDD